MDISRIARNSKTIILKTVDLGIQKVQLPVCELRSKRAGKTILITGGMDGDEYAGIEAVYQLIDIYAKTSFAGALVLIPIVNVSGFFAGTSKNPLDNTFPKHIFPGKKNGPPTERLMAWLYENYIRQCDVWIDLHSGASTEMLKPFIWTYETKNKAVDTFVTNTLLALQAKVPIIFEAHRSYTKSSHLAKNGTSYFLLEAGQQGNVDEKDVAQHIAWVKHIITAKHTPDKKLPCHRAVHITQAKQSGFWHSLFPKDGIVKKATVLGIVQSLDGKKLYAAQTNDSGIVLWGKSSLACNKGEDLFAIATNPQHI